MDKLGALKKEEEDRLARLAKKVRLRLSLEPEPYP